jgi:hypothetical protein
MPGIEASVPCPKYKKLMRLANKGIGDSHKGTSKINVALNND